MAIDTSGLKFPKPGKKQKKQKSKLNKKKTQKQDSDKDKEEDILFEAQVDQMTDFYETHAKSLKSIASYRFTKKLKKHASDWIVSVLESQPGATIDDVKSAWETTILFCESMVHPSHKDFMTFWWLTKNDTNYLDVLEGKYNKEFKNTYGRSKGSRWGSKEDFRRDEGHNGDTYI